MARSTAQEAFAEATLAMQRGDWAGFFACLDRADVVTIANNSVARFLMAAGPAAAAFEGLCAEHGIRPETLARVRDLGARIVEGAAVTLAAKDPAAMMEASRRHQQIVTEQRAAMKELVESAADMARFTAALEAALRADGGGESVSTRLFVGEGLQDVVVQGSKAWASRRLAGGQTEDVGFVRRRDGWRVRLFAKRPR